MDPILKTLSLIRSVVIITKNNSNFLLNSSLSKLKTLSKTTDTEHLMSMSSSILRTSVSIGSIETLCLVCQARGGLGNLYDKLQTGIAV